MKPQNFLGDNVESRLLLMSAVDYPRFEVIMGGNDAYREALVVDAEEFIGVKSYKAKGKRLTTFEVATINELEPTRFAPVKEVTPDENDTGEGGDDSDDGGSEENREFRVDTVVKTATEEIQTPEPIGKPVTPKKVKPTETLQNDSVLPDNIIGKDKGSDDIGEQLSLF